MFKENLEKGLFAYCFGVLNVLEFVLDRLHPIASLLLGAGIIAASSMFMPAWAKAMAVLLFWAPGMAAVAMVLCAYWTTCQSRT